MNRVIYGGLAVVAGCAAVLSFVSLTSLAARCGFDPRLAWLLPLVVDAGAAVATAIWLRTTSKFARAQALVLLAVSVVGNGLDHYLAAYQLAPPWLLVVAVAAIPPATLGATIHLARQGLTRAAPEPVVEPLTQSPELPTPDEAVEAPRTVAEAVAASSAEKWTFDAAVTWAAREGAGAKRIQSHTGLSEHHAKRAAAEAKKTHGLRVAR